MDEATQISSFIQEVGVPVATAMGLGGAAWWLIKYILGSVVEKIAEAQAQTEEDIRSIRDNDIKELKSIIVQLIDKTTVAQSDLIRLDTMIRCKWLDLPPDEKRISRNPDNKVK